MHLNRREATIMTTTGLLAALGLAADDPTREKEKENSKVVESLNFVGPSITIGNVSPGMVLSQTFTIAGTYLEALFKKIVTERSKRNAKAVTTINIYCRFQDSSGADHGPAVLAERGEDSWTAAFSNHPVGDSLTLVAQLLDTSTLPNTVLASASVANLSVAGGPIGIGIDTPPGPRLAAGTGVKLPLKHKPKGTGSMYLVAAISEFYSGGKIIGTPSAVAIAADKTWNSDHVFDATDDTKVVNQVVYGVFWHRRNNRFQIRIVGRNGDVIDKNQP